MKQSYRCGLLCLNIPLISVFFILLSGLETKAQEKIASVKRANHQLEKGNTAQQTPDEEIEVIATGEGETDNYFAPNLKTPLKTRYCITY